MNADPGSYHVLKPARSISPWRSAASGFILGMLGWLGARQLNLEIAVPVLPEGLAYLIFGSLGAAVGLTRLRPALWAIDGALCATILVVGYTPLIVGPARALVREDALRRCEAVVVLSSDIQRSGRLGRTAHDRLMRGLELLRQGYAKRLVLTRLPRPAKSAVPAAKEQLAALRFSSPIVEVGPVYSTYDEAVAVARLARERGWKEMLLVTSPLHTSRAHATFQKAGLLTTVQPCAERKYDLARLDRPSDRLSAFRDWFYETTAWTIYRLRGRV